jgi:sulfur carrier protein
VLRSLAVKVTVNGKDRDVSDGSTIADLVELLGFGRRQVVVEHNGEALERARFADVLLRPGDRLEVVRPVQGGAR